MTVAEIGFLLWHHWQRIYCSICSISQWCLQIWTLDPSTRSRSRQQVIQPFLFAKHGDFRWSLCTGRNMSCIANLHKTNWRQISGWHTHSKLTTSWLPEGPYSATKVANKKTAKHPATQPFSTLLPWSIQFIWRANFDFHPKYIITMNSGKVGG
jgi:hypothetical protein